MGCQKFYCKVDRCIICEFLPLLQCSQSTLVNESGRYSLTIGFCICTAVFVYSPAIHPEWRSLILDFNIVISSVTACRLFRELKLGLSQQAITETIVSNVVFRDMDIVPQQESQSTFELGTRDTIGVDVGGRDKPYPWDIEVHGARNAEVEDKMRGQGRSN
jgi:hypothetical protein